jgi:hypothetical protein
MHAAGPSPSLKVGDDLVRYQSARAKDPSLGFSGCLPDARFKKVVNYLLNLLN